MGSENNRPLRQLSRRLRSIAPDAEHRQVAVAAPGLENSQNGCRARPSSREDHLQMGHCGQSTALRAPRRLPRPNVPGAPNCSTEAKEADSFAGRTCWRAGSAGSRHRILYRRRVDFVAPGRFSAAKAEFGRCWSFYEVISWACPDAARRHLLSAKNPRIFPLAAHSRLAPVAPLTSEDCLSAALGGRLGPLTRASHLRERVPALLTLSGPFVARNHGQRGFDGNLPAHDQGGGGEYKNRSQEHQHSFDASDTELPKFSSVRARSRRLPAVSP
jgi:hypothetical protein